MRTPTRRSLLLLWLALVALLTGCPDAPAGGDGGGAVADAPTKQDAWSDTAADFADVALDADAHAPADAALDAPVEAEVALDWDVPTFEVIPLDRASFDVEVAFEHVNNIPDLYRNLTQGGGGSARCRPGEVADCACIDGREGHQTCPYRGVFLTCTCPAPRPRVVGPPRLVSPLTHYRVSSQRPSLHWVAPSGTARVRVELCGDRSCGRLLLREETTQVDTWRPTEPLAPGMVFWHVQALDGRGATLWESPTWLFYVGRRDAPHDTALVRPIDFNGDGYDDLLVWEPNSPPALRYTVRLGSSEGLQATIAGSLQLPEAALQGRTLFVGRLSQQASDFDGDGFTDVLVVAEPPPRAKEPAPAHAYVLYGGRGELFRRYSECYSLGEDRVAQESLRPYYVGDYNGDGFLDVMTYNLFAFLGGPMGPMEPRRHTGLSDHADSFAFRSSSMGDVDGDGWEDFPWRSPYVYYAGDLFAFDLYPTSGPRSSETVAMSDMNGDRRSDMMIFGNAYSFDYGSDDGVIPGDPIILLDEREGGFTSNAEGGSQPQLGDFNGDGLSDALLSHVWRFSPFGDTPACEVWSTLYRYNGNVAGVSLLPDYMIRSPCNSPWSYNVEAVGDYDGDGYTDMLTTINRVAAVVPGGEEGWGDRVYPVFACTRASPCWF